MSEERVVQLWPRLAKSAQHVLIKEMEILVEGYSGRMELHCHNGGVRLLRTGQDYKPPADKNGT